MQIIRSFRGALVSLTAVSAVMGSLALAPIAQASEMVEKGKAVATDRKKGNCMSCHLMGDAALPGNIGPPLIAMKARFPDRDALRLQIWDATIKNPQTMMPPFGKHKVLSDAEIDAIVDYLYTL